MEIYKFFNSAPGDVREYAASDFAKYFGSVLSAGLLLDENGQYGLQVTLDTGLNIKVKAGEALIKGYSYQNTSDLFLEHSLPNTTYDRIDRVVLRLDLQNQNRYIKAFIKEGVAGVSPVAPDLQRDENVYELSLAQIRLRANKSSINAGDITDERSNEDLCGIVQSIITVPTSVFQQQFDEWFNIQKDLYETDITEWQNQEKTAFEAWIESLHGILDGDVVGNLTTQITTLQQNLNTHKVDYVAHPAVATTTNSGNAYAVTLNPAPTSYVDTMGLILKVNADSTGATTINVNGLGAKAIKKPNGIAVSNLKANGMYPLRYNATTGNFILVSEGGEYGTATAAQVLQGFTLGTENGIVAGNSPLAAASGLANIVSGTATISGLSFTPTHVFAIGRYTWSSNIVNTIYIKTPEKAIEARISGGSYSSYDSSSIIISGSTVTISNASSDDGKLQYYAFRM